MNTHRLERHIDALRRGDNAAFDYIYEQTNRPAYFAILYIVRDKMYAEDILQDTYMKAIASLEQYRPGTNFAAWLCSIGRSLALNHVKKYRREVSADFEADAYRYGSAETPLPYVFDAAAKALDGEEYEIVMLCNVAGYKRREVAEMLGMPIGTVTWKNNRALEKLKEYLKEGGV